MPGRKGEVRRLHLDKLASPQDALHIPCQLHKQPLDEGVRDIHLRYEGLACTSRMLDLELRAELAVREPALGEAVCAHSAVHQQVV